MYSEVKKMNENIEKTLWMLILGVLIGLTVSVHILFLIILIPYCLIDGAYSRGRNWILYWNKVKVLKVKVR